MQSSGRRCGIRAGFYADTSASHRNHLFPSGTIHLVSIAHSENAHTGSVSHLRVEKEYAMYARAYFSVCACVYTHAFLCV